MLYMGKWDKESHKALKAFDLWNFEFKAAPKKGTVSDTPIPLTKIPFSFDSHSFLCRP